MKNEQLHRARKAVLVECINAIGSNIHTFAEEYLARDGRTVYRWLSDEIEIPNVVGRWLNANSRTLLGYQPDNLTSTESVH